MYKTHVFLLVAFFKIAVNALMMKRTTTIVAGVFAEKYSYDFMVKYIHDNTMTLKKIAISCSVIK